VGQAAHPRSHPPDPIRCRSAAITVPGSEIPLGDAKSADENTILFVERPAAAIASRIWAAKPRALTLFTSERPFLRKLDDLLVAIDDDGYLTPTKTADP